MLPAVKGKKSGKNNRQQLPDGRIGWLDYISGNGNIRTENQNKRFPIQPTISAMPRTKHFDIRLRILDSCLRNPQGQYDIEKLQAACAQALYEYDGTMGISKKQIYEDLNYLSSEQGYQAPIKRYPIGKFPRKVFFTYEDKNFTISRQPLSKEDAQQLRETLLTLSRFKGLPQFDWIQELSVKLQKLIDTKTSNVPIISFDNNSRIKGLEWIDPLYHAILSKQSLVVSYTPFFQKEETHRISPYLIKEFNNRWFVLSKSDQKEFLINLALDRISKISPGNSPYQEMPFSSPESFFEPIIGVTNDLTVPIQEVVLSVEKTLFPYVQTKPIHPSQTLLDPIDREWIRISLTIRTNYEFFSVILSHGPRIQILAPETTRNTLQTLIRHMGSLYSRNFYP